MFIAYKNAPYTHTRHARVCQSILEHDQQGHSRCTQIARPAFITLSGRRYMRILFPFASFFFLLSCHFSALPHFFPFFIFFSHWCFVIKSIISLFVLFDCVFLVLFYVVFFLSFFSCICCIVFCIVILENAKIDDANCFIHKFSQFSVLIHQPWHII